jgi:hypothetical protein
MRVPLYEGLVGIDYLNRFARVAFDFEKQTFEFTAR